MNLCNSGWLECFVVDVRLNALDDHIWNVVFVELEQAVEELLRLGHQTFAWFPIVVLLLTRLFQVKTEVQIIHGVPEKNNPSRFNAQPMLMTIDSGAIYKCSFLLAYLLTYLLAYLFIIIIMHEFHGDTSLKQNSRAAPYLVINSNG